MCRGGCGLWVLRVGSCLSTLCLSFPSYVLSLPVLLVGSRFLCCDPLYMWLSPIVLWTVLGIRTLTTKPPGTNSWLQCVSLWCCECSAKDQATPQVSGSHWLLGCAFLYGVVNILSGFFLYWRKIRCLPAVTSFNDVSWPLDPG